jgi:hypothetical protein
MKGRKTWERGYAAGLIDGEGCISIKKVNNFNKKRNPEYSLQVSMNLLDAEPIDFMYGCFGGSIYHIKASEYDNQHKDNWRWEINRKSAQQFLKQILPFLRIKKSQAELGIRFEDNRVYQKHENNRYLPFDKETLDKYEWFYRECQRLKTIHTSSAVVTTKRVEPIKSVSDSLVLQEEVTVS